MGAGAKYKLVFVDRLLATVHLRPRVTHDVLACWFSVDRSTITRAIGEIRPLLGERACTITAGLQLRPSAPRSSTTSARKAAPASSKAPRSACAARPPDAWTGRSSSVGRTSRTT
ncbi:transposase family protein [Streptomyces albidoflavus]